VSELGSALRLALGARRHAVVAAGIVIAALLALPIVVLAGTSLTESRFLTFPPKGLSTQWYSALGSDPQWTDSAWLSLRIGFLAASIATVCGVCAAFALRAAGPRVAQLLRTTFIAPLVVPYIVYALGIFNVLNEVPRMSAFWPIVLGQAALAFPLVLMVVASRLAAVDPVLDRAAQALGSTPARTIWRVDLPLIRGAVIGGWVLAFAFAFDEVVLALFLAGPAEQTLPVTIWSAIRDFVSPVVAAAAVAVICFAAGLSLLAWLAGRGRPRRAGGAAAPADEPLAAG
jgi:putative spermidine/putrescine transport system permease protein